MVSANVKRVLQEVVALTIDERQELLALLKVSPSLSNVQSASAQVDSALLEEGFLIQIPSPPTLEDIARYNAFSAPQIEGRPVSEVLIEERR